MFVFVRFQVLTAASIRALMMEAARTSETSGDIDLRTRQYIPEDSKLHVCLCLSVSCYSECKPGSSVSIVSGYGLDDRAIEVRYPAEAKEFFL
jgi:hypothetical protein